jgi:hypothetical protein
VIEQLEPALEWVGLWATLLLSLYLKSTRFFEWVMLGSNQRPLPCEVCEIDP